jgi:hypothetical protein
MNEKNRIPEKRPILFELFCPNCGGSLYALSEEEFYIGRSEHNQSLAGFTITKLECVLCCEKFNIEDVGLKYEKSIADELGWPFHVPIPDGPNAIPEHVEKRMRKREQEPDPRGDSIEDFYADHLGRSPLPFEKEVLRYVLQRKGRLLQNEAFLEEIATSEEEGCSNMQILGINGKFRVDSKKLPRRIRASDFSFGDIIESSFTSTDGLTHRMFYVVYGNIFQPIALIKPKSH